MHSYIFFLSSGVYPLSSKPLPHHKHLTVQPSGRKKENQEHPSEQNYTIIQYNTVRTYVSSLPLLSSHLIPASPAQPSIQTKPRTRCLSQTSNPSDPTSNYSKQPPLRGQKRVSDGKEKKAADGGSVEITRKERKDTKGVWPQE
jgi:hypothetical protein